MPKIYLDNAATTQIDKKVLLAMQPFLKGDFGNSSSLHSFGQKAREAVEKSRKQVADFLHCLPEEIYFTNGATESDNMAILGVVRASQKSGIKKPHIIVSSIEHPAVLETAKYLEKDGQAEVSYLGVDKEGIVKVGELEKLIKSNTVLVSVMYANNEIGTIQSITEIVKIISNFNRSKLPTTNYKLQTIFHTDAVQGANYLDCDAQKLGVDLLTLSGHKIYGPKGIGVLYIKKGVALEPILFGGGQEKSVRPGTENIAAIAGMGQAIAEISNLKLQIANIKKLRDKLLDGILKNIPKTYLNGSLEKRLPNNANISFEGVEGESILMALDQKGVAVSTGSACASGKLEASHVLLAMGLSHERAHSSIRFTLGKQTTEKEIDYALQVLPEIIKKLRKISGF